MAREAQATQWLACEFPPYSRAAATARVTFANFAKNAPSSRARSPRWLCGATSPAVGYRKPRKFRAAW